jgi:hypothetical protein
MRCFAIWHSSHKWTLNKVQNTKLLVLDQKSNTLFHLTRYGVAALLVCFVCDEVYVMTISVWVTLIRNLMVRRIFPITTASILLLRSIKFNIYKQSLPFKVIPKCVHHLISSLKFHVGTPSDNGTVHQHVRTQIKDCSSDGSCVDGPVFGENLMISAMSTHAITITVIQKSSCSHQSMEDESGEWEKWTWMECSVWVTVSNPCVWFKGVV